MDGVGKNEMSHRNLEIWKALHMNRGMILLSKGGLSTLPICQIKQAGDIQGVGGALARGSVPS